MHSMDENCDVQGVGGSLTGPQEVSSRVKMRMKMGSSLGSIFYIVPKSLRQFLLLILYGNTERSVEIMRTIQTSQKKSMEFT